ncbi:MULTISPECIES: MerR family transcriptional regulator [unclassified Bacillus (in: firmicutes)]|uniref:MerR family transcriptional regulator n=1 Tax=unclassified Bacillus (in: firmicutes) TaxID=185979 RepID=UPI0008E3AF47|nr:MULTISPECIES: MerR family transcriptional regulator [unclassified Bacillus (in: firmicutes)]SFB17027.1 DNA-binding transcriptional regulator, MerR family [Bacillus sp. UNCCL13]SFQ77673.1 DNA-binding transcriptional regulator, MerR family [Bacillus sp. cl95]
MYQISEIAKLLGITPHTLRYYEKEKIIFPVRNEKGERIFDETHLTWLKFVLKLKQTQMPIAHIREYTELVRQGENTTSARIKLLEKHRSSIQNQINNLLATEKMLDNKIIGYKEYIKTHKAIFTNSPN